MLIAGENASEVDRKDLVNTIVHAMDLNNVAIPWPETVKWAKRVGTEFAAQVDKEKAKNLPVSGFMDVRDDVSLAKLQIGFVKFVVQPFYEKVAHLIPECRVAVDYCVSNIAEWSKVSSGTHTLKEVDTEAEQDGELIAVAVETSADAA